MLINTRINLGKQMIRPSLKEQRKEESKLQQRGVSDAWKEFNSGFATQFDNDE